MIEDKLFLFILLIHFLADFGLQTHEQSTKKSESNKWLFYHVGVYSIIWLIASYMYLGDFRQAIIFAIITFVFHYTTDFITSRISKPFFKSGNFHDGFVVVGFDQVLHYIQLYYTFKIILLWN